MAAVENAAAPAVAPAPAVVPKHAKLGGYEFYRSIGSPKFVVAPMVDQSELPWRLLSKAPMPEDLVGPPETITTETGRQLTRYVGGAHLSYTPMVHSKMYIQSKCSSDSQFNLVEGEEGSEDVLAGVEGGDRPLFVQFCANDPDVLLQAAKLVEDRCDAVDINFGCPQGIAKKGHYGSFLQDEWELITKLISTLHENLKVPVTAKFRVFPDVEKTVRYARMLEAAGAQIITCHGRTREMKGQQTGLADWEQIKAVKAAVNIPVFANGNILYREDVDRCLEVTGCDGVMTAEGNLSNPALFMPPDHEHAYPSSLLLAERYLDIVDSLKTPTTGSAVKAHMFRVLKPILEQHEDLRTLIGKAGMMPEGRVAHYRAQLKLIAERVGHPPRSIPATPLNDKGFRNLPRFAAQPYVRSRPISSEVGVDADGNAAPSTAGPSRAASPAPGKAVVGGIMDKCSSGVCPDLAAMRCPARACLVHCREQAAVAEGMDQAEARKLAGSGGLVGKGCEAHESKVLARLQRKQERNQLRALKNQGKFGKRRRSRSASLKREMEEAECKRAKVAETA